MIAAYLDNNASTATDPRVIETMVPWLHHVGNASSAHAGGQAAESAVRAARVSVADLLGAAPREVVFTSGATEANNLAVKGVVAASSRRTVVTIATEHPSVLEPARWLADNGYDVRVVGVGSGGLPDLDQLASAIDDSTALVSVMAANNETGVLAPVRAVADIAHARGALLHTDATQLAQWGPLDVDALGADLLSLSAHKMHGPQGIGALFVRAATPLVPIAHGGGHERGLRSGTLNTAGIVGFGAAARLALVEGAEGAGRAAQLRDALFDALVQCASPVVLNGHATQRAPGTLNVRFPGTDADAVMAGAPTVAMATGSACSTGHPGPSHVLAAMGLAPDEALSAVRLGVSRMTTDREISAAVELISASVRRARARAEAMA